MSDERPKACPFCLGPNIGIHKWNGFAATCYCCKATGPVCDTEEEAYKRWNHRVPTQEILRVRNAVAAYQQALINRADGDLAGYRLIDEVQDIFDTRFNNPKTRLRVVDIQGGVK